jgi:3,4-dihydroxy 2-butanone 4-phosphate synthase/GTP cyclohydrolase II
MTNSPLHSAVRLVDEELAVPTEIRGRTFLLSAFRFEGDGKTVEHVTAHLGKLDGRSGDGVLTRIHSACISGDIFCADECDCGQQLEFALERIITEACGVIVYLADHDGRGSGSVEKLRAAASVQAGSGALPPDRRSFAPAAAMLRRLGIDRVRLLTSNNAKAQALRDDGIDVLGILPCPPLRTTDRIERYLRRRTGDAAQDFVR